MAIITVPQLQKIPQLKNQEEDYLEFIVTGVDQIIKTYCKRELESASYTEYYSGDDTPHLLLRQLPVTAISNLYLDLNGYFGDSPSAFPATSELTEGTHFVLKRDRGGVNCNSGIVLRISGTNAGFTGFYPESFYSGKLAARKMPVWPLGNGNLKVVYTAGYATIPKDLVAAGAMIAAGLARDFPVGGRITTESLGAYSYTLDRSDATGKPDIGTVASILSRYRMPAFQAI